MKGLVTMSKSAPASKRKKTPSKPAPVEARSLLQQLTDAPHVPVDAKPEPHVAFIEGEPPDSIMPAETVQQAEERRKSEDDAVKACVDPEAWARIEYFRGLTDERMEAANALPPVERLNVFLGWALDAMLLADKGLLTPDQRRQMVLGVLTRAGQVDLPDVPGIVDPVAVKGEIRDALLAEKMDDAAVQRLRKVKMLLEVAGRLSPTVKMQNDQRIEADFQPTDHDLSILKALSMRRTRTGPTKLSVPGTGETTVKERLQRLEQVGLVDRAEGKRKGYAITLSGRAMLTPKAS